MVNYIDKVEKTLEPCLLNNYKIEIGKSKYRIDFEKMKQINILDSYKQRRIKRLVIPEKIENIMLFLKNNNVIGISGVKF